ncbi:hypothetical protein V1511DRAFT_506440 [Dipodascopsis uninucleata]
MGFVTVGVSFRKVRQREAAIFKENKRKKLFGQSLVLQYPTPIEESTSRVPLTSVQRCSAKLDGLPTEVLQKVFLFSENFDLPFVNRKIATSLSGSEYLHEQMLHQIVVGSGGDTNDQISNSCRQNNSEVNVYDRRFVKVGLIKSIWNTYEFSIDSIGFRLTRAPFNVEKLQLLEFLIVRGGKPVNPSESTFKLVECIYEEPGNLELDGQRYEWEVEPKVLEVYKGVFGQDDWTHAGIRERILAILFGFVEGLELDAETVDLLFGAEQYQLIAYGISISAIDPTDPELWELVTCRGDTKAMGFLYRYS